MNKNDAYLPPHQVMLLDKAKALKARNAREERRRKGENEGAWPLRTWVISDGTAGMLAQCLALAKAMRIQAEDIRAVPTPLLRAFPKLANLPGWQLTLGRKPDWLKANQWPDLCITCGRRMAGISIGVRRLAMGKTKTIHIQDPNIEPHYFDLMITPCHDDIAQKAADGQMDVPNLLTTTGALNRLDEAEIVDEAAALKISYNDEQIARRALALVMIGGHNRRYKAGADAFTKVAEELAAFVQMTGAMLAIVPSRRTPKRGLRMLSEQLESRLGEKASWVWDGAGHNPYPGLLGLAKFVIVTSDSVNMTSEAALTGKPLLITELVEEQGRISHFHQIMRAGRHTARLTDVLAQPERLKEAFVVLDERISISEAVYKFFEEA